MNSYEKNTDHFINYLGEMIAESESNPGVLNIARLKQMRECVALIEQVSQNCEVSIKVTLHEPFASMGNICVESDSLEFYDSELLGRAIGLANNIELYPTVKGHVRFVLTFHGLVKRIDR